MAINKKGKREIIVNNQNFLWWGFWEYDQTAFDGNQIKIIAENQSLLCHYGLEQKNEKRYIYLSLRDNKTIKLKAPKFESEKGTIASKGISNIIKWVKIEILNPKIEIEDYWPTDLKNNTQSFIKKFNELINKV